MSASSPQPAAAPAQPDLTEPVPVPGLTAAAPGRPGLRVVTGGPPPTDDEVRLELAPYDLEAALSLQRALGIGHVLAQVLVRRGLHDEAAARAFLRADERHDPAGLRGIDRAVAAIRTRIESGRRITVHGDYDVDGVCATAIMVRALESLGANVDWFIPSRIEDGYGLSAATVQRLAARGCDLIVCVDCAVTAVDEIAAARAAGIDAIVCDHHAPRSDGALPDCPVIHPGLCDYPCPDLCGAGVAHKLAQALGAATAGEDSELVALATIADLVALRGENRRLVREGLRALAITTRPGLRALIAVAGVDPGSIDAGAVGFRLAPRLNAAGRLRRADIALELLLTQDPDRARAIAGELDELNAERRAIERRILWEAEAQVAQLQERSPRMAYVLWGEGWHPGVVGIVASRIVERHHRPALLIAVQAGATGSSVASESSVATGSGRSIPGFDLLGALRAVAGHLERYGGHRAAAGVTVRPDALPALREAFERHAAGLLTASQLVRRERVDAVVSGHELGLDLVEQLEALEPCGIANPEPRLLVAGARFSAVRAIGEGRHSRFEVISGGVRAQAVAFGCGGRPVREPDTPHDASFRLQRNAYNGAVEPRLVLGHALPCAPAPIRRLRPDPDCYVSAVLAELDRPVTQLDRSNAPQRTVIDRRGHSPLAVLADARAAADGAGRGAGEGGVLAICADVPRRLAGLEARAGGFTLASYAELERDPAWIRRFGQLVALDPPTSPAQRALLDDGNGHAHLTWGPAELRFTEQMHELEYGLRASLVALYRTLRERQRATGEELERLLRGDGPHSRSVALAGRLVRVLAELELVSLDRDLPALTIAATAPTALERSPSFRIYDQRYEDGRRYLSSANPPPSG